MRRRGQRKRSASRSRRARSKSHEPRCLLRRRYCVRKRPSSAWHHYILMETAYAQALWRMVTDGKTPHAAVDALRTLLTREGREALLPRIARAFERLAEREMHKTDMILTVAREKDERAAKQKAKVILAKLKIETDDLKTRVDDTLVGGWRLEGRGMLVDASYKTQLLDMYN